MNGNTRALLFQQFTRQNNGDGKIGISVFEDGVQVKVNMVQLIDALYVSPFSGAWFKPIIESIVDHLLPDFILSKLIQSGIRDR